MSIILLIKNKQKVKTNFKVGNNIKIEYLKNLKIKKVYIIEGIIKKLKKGKSLIKMSVKFGTVNMIVNIDLFSPLILNILLLTNK